MRRDIEAQCDSAVSYVATFSSKLGRMISPKKGTWESTDTMNRPMNCSTHRCLAQNQTSDIALSSDPFAIDKCVLPFLHRQHRTQARSGKVWTEFACKGVLSYSLGAQHLLQLYHAHLRGARLYAISCTKPSRNCTHASYVYTSTEPTLHRVGSYIHIRTDTDS